MVLMKNSKAEREHEEERHTVEATPQVAFHWGCGNRGVCICWLGSEFKFGVPYGTRTRVAAVKEK